MSDYTVLRVSVDADAVATALEALPGITVVEADDHPDSGRVDVLPDRETDEDAAASETSDTTELPYEPAEDDTPAWREYGLLGVGASLVMLGIATAGIWWYRRRTGDETDEWTPEAGETPAPVEPDAVERPTADVETPSPTVSSPEESSTDDDSGGRTVLGDETPDADEGPQGRTEDREETEWTTRTETVSPEPSTELDESEPSEDADEPETTADPRDQVDVAPLLGVAFLAVSGAVVRWLQRAGDAE